MADRQLVVREDIETKEDYAGSVEDINAVSPRDQQLAFAADINKLNTWLTHASDVIDNLPRLDDEAGESAFARYWSAGGIITYVEEQKTLLQNEIDAMVESFGRIAVHAHDYEDGIRTEQQAIQAAIDHATTLAPSIHEKVIVRLDANRKYLFDNEGVTVAGTVHVMGYGATIESNSTTNPIVALDGSRCTIWGVTLRFIQNIDTLGPNCIALKLINCSYITIRDIYVVKAYGGIVQTGLQADGQSFVYSINFENIRVARCYMRYLQLVPRGGGNTGSTFTNVKLAGTYKLPEADGEGMDDMHPECIPLYFETTHEITFSQLNIEWMKFPKTLCYIGSEGMMIINGLHLEGIRFKAHKKGLFQLLNMCGLFINGLSQINCEIRPDEGEYCTLVEFLGDDSTVGISGLQVRDFDWFSDFNWDGYEWYNGDTSQLTTDYRLAQSLGNNNSCEIRGFVDRYSAMTLVDSFGTDGRLVVTRLNNEHRAAKAINSDVFQVSAYSENSANIEVFSGSVTVTSGYHLLNTEGSTPTDNLFNVFGCVKNGRYAFRLADAGRVVTLKHTTFAGGQNIKCKGGVDYTPASADEIVEFFFDGEYLVQL